MNPMQPTTVPNMIGFIEPNLETNRPDAGPNTRNTRYIPHLKDLVKNAYSVLDVQRVGIDHCK